LIRTPYAGTISRIKWLGKINNELQVEDTLILPGSWDFMRLWKCR